MANDLIEPQWTIKKTIVLNEIDKEMVRRNTWQGKYYKKQDRIDDPILVQDNNSFSFLYE